MDDGKKLSEFGDEELAAELMRRRVSKMRGRARQVENALLQDGDEADRAALEAFFRQEAAREDDQPKACPKCGARVGVRAKERWRKLRAVGGEVSFARNYHYCDGCQYGFHPLDFALGLSESGDLTPEMERRVLDFGVNDPFEQAAERWNVHYPTSISANLVRRVVERQGTQAVAMNPVDFQQALLPPAPQPARALYVQTDGSMVPTRGPEASREVKVGVILRAENHVSWRESSRGQVSSARYVAHLGGLEEFGRRLDAALQVEDAEHAQEVVWVGDGAPWNWNLADEVCRQAVQILDWTHAVQAGQRCGMELFGEHDPCAAVWDQHIQELLWRGHVGILLEELEGCLFLARGTRKRKALKDLIRYYRTNRKRMNYASFRERNLPIGSGFVESAHKHVIQPRMKRAGQHWDPERGDRMAVLRAAYRTAGAVELFDAIEAAA